MIPVRIKKIFNVKEKTIGPGGFWGFANAMIGLIAGTDRFIGLDSTEPEKPAASQPASRQRFEHDEDPPARPDQ